MSHKPELPVEVLEQINEEAANRYKATEEGILMAAGYRAGATAYATQLHQAQQKLEQADTKLNEAIDLLREVHETGYDLLLMDRIKTFLYGVLPEHCAGGRTDGR